MIRNAIEASEFGWAHLGSIGSYINKPANDFDSRNYGFSKLSDLIWAKGLLEAEHRENRLYGKGRSKRG